MRILVFMVVAVLVVPAMAATIGDLKPTPTDPTNAYWQIIDDGGNNVLACVMEGETVYGNGDDCRVRNTDAFNFTTSDVINVEFDIKVTLDAPEDHCLFQAKGGGDSGWTTFEDFTVDTVGYEHRSYDLVYGEWGDWTTKNNVYVRFRWISNAEGTAEGVRIDDYELAYGPYGTFGADNIFSWTTSHGSEPLSIDCSPWLTAGEGFYFEFNYNTHGEVWQWYWAVDDVWVYDPDGDLLAAEAFDSWIPDGWWLDGHSEDGVWEQDTDHDPGSDSGPPNAQCDSDEQATWTYNASMFTPTMPCRDDNVTLDFFSNFQVFITDEAILNILHASPILEYFFDDFESGLGLWTVNDVGGNLNITPSSLGVIKGMYRE